MGLSLQDELDRNGVSRKWDAQICCCSVGRHVRGRRLALGWPPAVSQEERLSHGISSPVCARRLGDFLAALDRSVHVLL